MKDKTNYGERKKVVNPGGSRVERVADDHWQSIVNAIYDEDGKTAYEELLRAMQEYANDVLADPLGK
jgi:hypothetical protein